LSKVGEFLCEPSIDPDELFVGILVLVGFVRKGVMALLDIEPVHLGLAHGLGELEGGHAGEVVDEGIDQQVDLHPAEGGEVVV
jgi:hypothetical protein